MKTITFKQAYDLLNTCSAVIWGTDFHALTYPVLYDEEMEDLTEDQFLLLEYTYPNDVIYTVKFYRGANQNPKVDGVNLILVDSTGKEVAITVLIPQDLEHTVD